MKTKTHVVKAWSVIWLKKARPEFQIKEKDILAHFVGGEVENFNEKDNQWLYADAVVFKTKKDAYKHRCFDKNWKVVPVTITYSL